MQRFFKLLLIILLVITAIETAIYFYISKGFFNFSEGSSNSFSNSATSNTSQSLVSKEMLDFLSNLKASPYQKYYLKTETNGYIGEAKNVDETWVSLKIVDETGNKIRHSMWQKSQNSNHVFILVSNQNESKIDISQVKVNDKVRTVSEMQFGGIEHVDIYIYR